MIWHRIIYIYDLLSELVRRDLKLRYKRSVLGIGWSLLNPLAQLVVFTFVFQRVLPLHIQNYTAFLFTGLLVWNWFQLSINAATGSIVDNRELVRRPKFPVWVLPVVMVTSNFIHFLLALPVLLFFLAISGVHQSAAILTLPILWAIQFLLTLSLAYLIAALHVSFRDTQYLVGICLMLGFYLTPVFYNADSLPIQYQVIYHLNPMTILIESYRAILLSGDLTGAIPLVLFGLAAPFLLLIGYTVFHRASARFVEEL